jgi:hypothetical protein
VVIRSASGQNRSFLTNYWHPTCWLPDDTIFAANLLKSTLGTLNPATGAITTIGHFPSSAALFVLDCPTDLLGRLRRRPWDRPGPS